MTAVGRVSRRILAFAALPVALIAWWWFGSANSTQFFSPSLQKIVEVFPSTWTADRFVGDVVPSLRRLLIGYAIAVVAGVAIGVLIGGNRILRALFEPVLEFLRAIPPPVLVPVLILIAGIDDLQKILVIVSGAIWPVLLNTVDGVRGVDDVLGDTCRSYRIRGPLRLRTFVLRSASPKIMTGARQALAIALILMVISEMKASSNGLGHMIVEWRDGFQMPEMYSGVIVLSTIGVVLALLFRLAERRVLYWYHGVRAAERGPH